MTHILSQPSPAAQQATLSRKPKSQQGSSPQPPRDETAIHILPPAPPPSSSSPEEPRATTTSTATAAASSSIRIPEINPTTLPTIPTTSLPLPIDSPHRIYASSIPGLRLTHPGGWLEGGAGPGTSHILEPSQTTARNAASRAADPHDPATKHEDREPARSIPPFAQAFVAEHSVSSPETLRRAVDAATAAQLEELTRRMRERKDAIARNARVQRQIDELGAEREMERRVRERVMRDRKEREKEGEEAVADVVMG